VEDIVGELRSPETLARAWALGFELRDELASHNAHDFFERLGDSVITVPTFTNVNHFRAVYITVEVARDPA
jgi:glycerate 2-kinase